jgi:hypothetical protein
MITPTVGRIVHYRPDVTDRGQMNELSHTQPFKADIVYVHDNGMVNLRVTDHKGKQYVREAVLLRQDGDPEPKSRYCEWMQYQKDVAAGKIAPTLHAKPCPEGNDAAAWDEKDCNPG